MFTLITAAALALGVPLPATPAAELERCAEVTRCWTVELDGHEVDLAECAEEDGNPDGRPCMWQDPDTARLFYVDSANYRG